MLFNRQIELVANDGSLDKESMTLGARIEQRRKQLKISQAELARRVGVRQSTINSLINGSSRSSRSIVQIARELQTTPAFLYGEIDDPDQGAPPPTPAPSTQVLIMPVVLPSEDGLARAFEGVLAASRGMNEAELARELAKRLPTMFSLLRGALTADHGSAAAAQSPPIAPAERQQA
ncbi:helix-turn-helix domain-containing protein [Sphingomonas yunnanensis]|uniref:helix-turn-helix domain-containing protein n=1 Tax=Sphingomonas yunnanensis TaxID=310400 RepID=UPI001CA69750|nr:helix-turn-helix transcriptional regulator [Sphingomonas yunnanensis]MBY9062454.1 helix-turn-helix domain-containing protein [Sphingomonas yunnanensis]